MAGNGLGGRHVSADIIRSQTDSEYGSVNRAEFESIKDQLDHWVIYDNSVYERSPVLIAEGRRRNIDDAKSAYAEGHKDD